MKDAFVFTIRSFQIYKDQMIFKITAYITGALCGLSVAQSSVGLCKECWRAPGRDDPYAPLSHVLSDRVFS